MVNFHPTTKSPPGMAWARPDDCGGYLRGLREKRRLSLRAVGRAIGYSHTQVSHIERNLTVWPLPLDLIQKIARLYDRPEVEVLGAAGFRLVDDAPTRAAIDHQEVMLALDRMAAVVQELRALLAEDPRCRPAASGPPDLEAAVVPAGLDPRARDFHGAMHDLLHPEVVDGCQECLVRWLDGGSDER